MGRAENLGAERPLLSFGGTYDGAGREEEKERRIV